MKYLRGRAKESIKEYATEILPEQYEVCLSALDTILKHAYEIFRTSPESREKLYAMELFKDTHLVKLELLSNATTIDNALNYITNKQSQQQEQQQSSTQQSSLQEQEQEQQEGGQQEQQEQQQQYKEQQQTKQDSTTIF
jgi:DNA replication protein DnaD